MRAALFVLSIEGGGPGGVFAKTGAAKRSIKVILIKIADLPVLCAGSITPLGLEGHEKHN
jgi:hypothetical protein